MDIKHKIAYILETYRVMFLMNFNNYKESLEFFDTDLINDIFNSIENIFTKKLEKIKNELEEINKVKSLNTIDAINKENNLLYDIAYKEGYIKISKGLNPSKEEIDQSKKELQDLNKELKEIKKLIKLNEDYYSNTNSKMNCEYFFELELNKYSLISFISEFKRIKNLVFKEIVNEE